MPVDHPDKRLERKSRSCASAQDQCALGFLIAPWPLLIMLAPMPTSRLPYIPYKRRAGSPPLILLGSHARVGALGQDPLVEPSGRCNRPDA